MRRRYSGSSVKMHGFSVCLEGLSRLIPHMQPSITGGHRDSESGKFIFDINKLTDNDFPVVFKFKSDDSIIKIYFDFHWSIFSVNVDGGSVSLSEDIFSVIVENLGLEEPTEEDKRSVSDLRTITSLLWRIHDMQNEFNARTSQQSIVNRDTLNCFVSFRFDDHNKALVFELKEFFDLVGVNCITGLGYEPRSISEKVLERLSQPIDLFIVIYSSSGDSSWLNQEVGVAKGKGLPVLVLREEGASYDSGLLGDLEFLPFPKDYISKTFIGILQALSYLKSIVLKSEVN